MKEQNTETYNTNPDEKKSTKFDPHDFPKEEEQNIQTPMQNNTNTYAK